MSADFGFDFRNTSGFVTDPANCTWAITADTYPQTRIGTTFGYTNGPLGGNSDNSASVDSRLAGVAIDTNVSGSPSIWRVDLPHSGAWLTDVALGNQVSGESNLYLEIRDGATPLLTLDKAAAISANQYWDASGVLRTSDTDWVNNHTLVQVTFTGTVANVAFGKNQAARTTIAHVRFTEVVTSVPPDDGFVLVHSITGPSTIVGIP